jgi:hypothetical protein
MRLKLLPWIIGPALGLGLTSQAAEQPPVRLQVKPVMCIQERDAATCRMAMQVKWQSVKINDYCLSVDMQALPLRCWEQAQAGELREQRTASEDFVYRLAAAGVAAESASVKVQVLRLDSADRRRGRRARHVWDVL